MNLYCLANFNDLSLAIHQPLKHSNRIKYTAFDVSVNYIVLGATSGSLYLFNRQGKFLLLVPSKHGSVNHVAISANEKFVAFTTQRSVVCVYAVNLSAQAQAPQVLFTNLCSERKIQITCLRWTQDEKQFYYGDARGQVNLVLLSVFMGTNRWNMSVHPILYLESAIVQIDVYESLLLISTITKCILCNTEYEEYKQIGNKPRDGYYGACFIISNNEGQYPSRIYCARPGSRIWEVDVEGELVRTHQFKANLACAPVKIQKGEEEMNKKRSGPNTMMRRNTNSNNLDDLLLYSVYNENDNIEDNDNNDNDNDDDIINNIENDDVGNDEMLDYQPQNLQFPKLQKLHRTGFLLAFTELGIYIFDIRTSMLVLWCNQFERIVDARVLDTTESTDGDIIVIFTQTGSLYSIQLQTIQLYARLLIASDRLLECARLMRKNVKYFADKAHEDYELNCCNRIKDYLMARHQYELLNDLSVIFDAVAQCECNNVDNNSSSGGSTGTTADRNSNSSSGGGGGGGGAIATTTNHPPLPPPPSSSSSSSSSSSNISKTMMAMMMRKKGNSCDDDTETNSQHGLFVLENAFCDNLKGQKRSTESQFKEALLTVTGKFGKNIIKYKFNVFQKDPEQLVQDLIPTPKRSMPFNDIELMMMDRHDDRMEEKKVVKKEEEEQEEAEDIVCHTSKTMQTMQTIKKGSSTMNSTKINKSVIYPSFTAEQKTIYNLYLICKSSKMGQMNFLERYRSLFDEYTAPELIRLLEKLIQLMIDHGDERNVAQCHCYEMYFHYLNPELIWEMDDTTRDYIREGFKLLNSNNNDDDDDERMIIRCINCHFPIRHFDNNNCQFHALGAVLIRYHWSRQEQYKYLDILNVVPSLYDVWARLYLAEGNIMKVIGLIMAYGQPELLMEMGRTFNQESWSMCFEQFVELQLGRLTCVHCASTLTTIDNIGGHFFYTWNCFLNIALEYLDTNDLLALILKWSQFIPNDAIDRDFYTSCLLKG